MTHGEALTRRGFLGLSSFSLIASALPAFSSTRDIVYRFGDMSLPHRHLGAIIAASRYVGIPANLVLAIGERESRLDVTARPIGMRSTAVGLHQFLEQTWLEVIYENPVMMGFPEAHTMLRRVQQNGRTRYRSSNDAWLASALAAREDAYRATVAMGLYVLKNKSIVEERTGYRLKMNGEIYIPHLLGPGGGSQLITVALNTPDRRTNTIFSESVLQNRGVFFERGRNRTAREVVIHLILDMEQRRKKYRDAEKMFHFYQKRHILTQSN